MRRELAACAASGAAEPAGARVRAGSLGAFDLALALSVAVSEIALVLAARAGIALSVVLLGHVAVIALGGLALWVRRKKGFDLTVPLMLLIATTASGALGAVASLLALVWLARPAAPSPLLAEWYERISLSTTTDPVTRLAERVAAGRVIETRSTPPASFAGVIRAGELEQRQRALGLIARKFHLGYLPTLAAALRSPEPVIRVQAAAVAAHVSPGLAAEASRLAAAAEAGGGGDGIAAIAIARDLASLTASGLLDKPAEDRAKAAIDHLLDRIDPLALPPVVLRAAESRAQLDAFERMLLERGMASRLRLVRLVRRHAASATSAGTWRVRRRTPRRRDAGAQAGPAIS